MNPTVELLLKLMDQVSGPLDNIGGKFDVLFQKVNWTRIAMDRMEQGTLQLGQGLAGGLPLKALFDQASDLNETVSKMNVVFGQNATFIDTWSKNSADAMGLSKSAALDAAAGFGNLFTALGVAQPVAAEYSMNLTQLAADLASFNNTSVPDALDALRSAMVGEMDPIQRYGAALNDTYLKQEAFNLGLIKTTKVDLDPLTKMMATYSLVLKQTNAAHGDFERTADGAANMQRRLMAHFQNLSTQLGQVLLPIGIRVLEWLLDLIKNAQKFADEHPTLVKWIMYAAVAMVGMNLAMGALNVTLGAFLLLAVKVSAAIMVFRILHLTFAMIGGMSSGLPFLTSLTRFLQGGILPRITMLFRGLGTVAMWAIRGIGMAIRANPLGAALTVIGGLLVWMIRKFNEAYGQSQELRNIVDQVLSPLQNAFAGVQAQLHLLTETWRMLVDTATLNIAKAFGFDDASSMFDSFLYNLMFGVGWVIGTLMQIGILLATWFLNIFSDLLQIVSGFFTWLTGVFSGNEEQIQMGQTMMLQGITNLWNRTLGGILDIVFLWGGKLLDSTVTWVQSTIDTLSTMGSRWLEVGKTWISNLWDGIAGKWNDLRAGAADMGWQIAETLTFGLVQGPAAKAAQATGTDVATGLGKGILSDLSPEKAILQQTTRITGAARESLDVHSPSRLFMGIGNFVSQGLALGISGTAAQAVQSARSLALGVITAGMVTLPAVAGPVMPDIPSPAMPQINMGGALQPPPVSMPSIPGLDAIPMSLDFDEMEVPEAKSITRSLLPPLVPSQDMPPPRGQSSKATGQGGRKIVIQNLTVQLPGVKDTAGFMADLQALLEAYGETDE